MSFFMLYIYQLS